MSESRTQEIFEEQRNRWFRRVDRMFAILMMLQWFGGIMASLILSPLTWTGPESEIHPHVWLAIFLGGAIASLPVFLAWRYPGRMLTRQTIAVAQILFSSLFIHISGGRIETHFHVFGSLAFLAFYRDWRILILPTTVVALDHYIRGVYWPESVFGTNITTQWRWLEHAAWVVFEDLFLILSCHYGANEILASAKREAELERMNAESRRKAAELEHAYQSKNAVIETALDAVVSMDGDGLITGWNSQAEYTFGWLAEEAVGRPLAAMIIPPHMRERFQSELQRYRETGKASVLNRRVDITALHREGTEFAVELAIAPISTGDAISFCAFVRDITERKEAAAALHRAKDAAEASNLAKTSFLAHMSHEIRTPLNGILGFADVLLKMGAEATLEERQDYLETINCSGRHLLSLVNDVLDLTKIESGQMDVESVRCAPHAIIADAISILRVRAQEKGIDLEYRWEGGIPDSIETDPSRFRQLLMNLVGNAIKFTERGRVDVIARLETNSERSCLAVEVVDTGIGIAPEHLESIFDPFIQADQSITRRFGGTGLGLTISRQIAGLLGGDLSVRSVLGEGTSFKAKVAVGSIAGIRLLDVPAADLMQRTVLKVGESLKLPPATILLVEDGVTNRKLMSLVLGRAGAIVMSAENGQIGLDLTEKYDFDLILMDMQMPVLDGYRAATELRRRGATLPIIALTAHSMTGDEERCRAAGCSGYLTKPIDSDRLLNAVADVLRAHPEPAGRSPRKPGAFEPLISTLPMDDSEFREIVEEFVERLGEKLQELQAAVEAAEKENVARCAHWIKGAAGTAGFSMFTAFATAVEQHAKSNRLDLIPEPMEQMRQLHRRIAVPAASVS